MGTVFSTGLGIGVLVCAAIVWLFNWEGEREPVLAVADLPASYRQLLEPELSSYGRDYIYIADVPEFLAVAQERLKRETQAIEADAAKREAEHHAELAAERAKIEREFARTVPAHLQAIINRHVKAQADAEAGLTEARGTIAELRAVNGRLRELYNEAHTELQAVSASSQSTRKLQSRADHLAQENAQLRQSLNEHAQALGAAQSWASSSVHVSQIAHLEQENKALSLEKKALQIQLDQLCRERALLLAQNQELAAILQQAATRPSSWQVYKPPAPSRPTRLTRY